MKKPISVLAALLLLASIILSACGGGPQFNGETVSFNVGESKSITNGETTLSMTRQESGWTCQENGAEVNLCVQNVAGRVMFFFSTDKIGEENLKNSNGIDLYGDWTEVTKGG